MTDTVLHFLIGSLGLGMGSLLKIGFDKLAAKFWDKEAQEYAKWKAAKGKL
jgi:hypothetical protein